MIAENEICDGNTAFLLLVVFILIMYSNIIINLSNSYDNEQIAIIVVTLTSEQ